jgi:transposase
MLSVFGVDIELVIMDAGYASNYNLSELLATKIPFLTRLPDNRKDYRKLIEEESGNLKDVENLFLYGDRTFAGKRVQIPFEGYQLFAYIMLDIHQEELDIQRAMQKFKDDEAEIRHQNLRKASLNAGKFILISSCEYSIDEVLPLYYTRQTIEQVFDTNKNYANGFPLRGHSEETILGFTLVAFIATIVYSCINQRLSDSKLSAHSAIKLMRELRLKVFDNVKILEELTKEHKAIFNCLKLSNPYMVESGTRLHKSDSFLANLNSPQRGRGRPKGSKNKQKTSPRDLPTKNSEAPRRRGRPKGSKNKKNVSQPT